ncbi:MerR family transcriptional regulator [Paenibacillus sp. YYML68]|uniref:MerR family transcriptional regulator n=1 Tax=Paenibacillus sp. YYML68 TaxID=2909250 RepID=UPI002492929B|nr:MerR family transcriptional regulator [Paenibacillus sp. YYML68]
MENKIMSIGTVCEMTGLTERQIRYYEERKLIFPSRTHGGTRKYSLEDVETIREIGRQLQEGASTFELKELFTRGRKRLAPQSLLRLVVLMRSRSKRKERPPRASLAQQIQLLHISPKISRGMNGP